MNGEDVAQGLKQFIAATVSQQTSDIVAHLEKMDARLDKVDTRLDKVDARLDSVETKIDDLTVAVADAIDDANEATETKLQDHEKRIAHLEQKST